MVSKNTMNIIIGILILCLGAVLTVGFLASHGTDNQANNSISNTQSSNHGSYQDAEWAKSTSNNAMIYDNDTTQFTDALNNKDYYSAIKNMEKYRQDLETEIKNIDNYKVSPELQSCKDEYKLALLNDYSAATFTNSSINQLMSGNLIESSATAKLGTEELETANKHYDNVTSLLNVYNSNHPNSKLEINFLYHNVDSGDKPQEKSQNEVATSEQASKPVTKTLTDKEPESEEPHASEESDDVEDSSSSNIFDYCTWQAETTKTIGKYYEAPEGESYVVVTIKLDNTGDETYSTNGNYWHLKIGDMYYQYDTATYDSSLNHMTTDVGPGGKITTKIAYLVDGEPAVGDLDLYYDGPGSEGTITS
ncbi:DUF4352 domain-containing protein [Methanosarcina sp.]|uniref:DUF4352 domain-containing protein n=1 Tax=Methanosarcina sp. TaxID=2213 RepID=UPI002988232A|nr:DUF4352 domain-containing protein [Methanosarcina sp.]MDW5550764.1 DUF4352 domain-containing protein [Methanosarcina sp.]MDW5553299.1 DUF4352 domain-containing protein [Methanosarcina sp.]MDW5558238.1 DUF4352 domain-containing protein [Methanosarcina sp.]